MKKLFILMLSVVLMAGACKSDWRNSENPMAGLPPEKGKMYKTPAGAHVYVSDESKPPTSRELELIDTGISHQLVRSNRSNPNWVPAEYYMNWKLKRFIPEYSVMLVSTSVRGIYPDTLGCGILDTFGGYAAGTVKGIRLTGGKAVSDGDGPWILVPRLEPGAHCEILFMRGVDHESEHVRLMNDVALLTYYQGREDSHPIFPVQPGDQY